MTQDEAFLQAIIEAPDDDAHRLVYADWLDDNGDPERAEFIRLQCALARRGAAASSRRRLYERARGLLRGNARRWGAPPLGRPGWRNYRRGFVEVLRIGPPRFLRSADRLFQLFPIRDVRFEPLEPEWDSSPEEVARFVRWLAEWPALERVEALALWGHSAGGAVTIDPHALPVLLASPHLRRLRALDIQDNLEMDGAAEALAQSPVLGQLTALVLGLFGPGVVDSLASSPHVPRLERLRLPYNELEADAAHRLAAWPALATVIELDLSGNPLGPFGAQGLAGSPHCRRLRKLRLGQDFVGDQGLLAWVNSGALAPLRWLDLEQCWLGPEAARALGRLVALHTLNLRANRLGDEGARALAESPGLAGLRRLNVGINGLGDEGARALARSPYLRLTELIAYANALTDDGVAALAASPILARTRRLRLGGNHAVGDAAALALAGSPHLKRVRLLDLAATGIGPEGRRALRARFGERVRLDSPPQGHLPGEEMPGGEEIPF
jgi:uncharacterized protein (TIGR02996 family)